jgi:hypothetical protein
MDLHRETLEMRRDTKLEERIASDALRAVYPQPSQPSISSLPIYFDGLKWIEKDKHHNICQYGCRTITGMQKRCKDEHH